MRSWCSRVALCSGVSAAAVVAVLALAPACVPPGNAPPYDAGAPAVTAATAQPKRPPLISPPLTTVFEDNFDRVPGGPSADAGHATAADAGKDAGPHGDAATPPLASASATATATGAASATSELGPDWLVVGGSSNTAWRIEQGRLCGQNAKNRGVWLNRTLPVNARIEFDAETDSPEGDLKAEVWGDGQSGATTISYTNATSYLVIFGGWKNTLHVLARRNEHGSDRKFVEVKPTTDEFRERAVANGVVYHFKIERSDGKTVRWWVNDTDMLEFQDPEPLVGATHDHFGFNDWQVHVCFDNVKVTPLSSL